jgi:foldase protein PrsA
MLHLKRASARRALAAILAAVLLGALLAGCGKKEAQPIGLPGEGQGEVIATYKGGQITQTEFDKFAAFVSITDPTMGVYLQIPAFKEQFVRQLALYKVLAGQATDEQNKKAEEDVKLFEGQLEDYIKAYPQVKEEMTKQNISADEMKQIRRMMSAGEQIISAKSEELAGKVTDEEIKAEFDKNPNDYNKVTVRHILVSTMDMTTGEEKRSKEEALERALEAKDKLENGADWNTIAKEYSEDPGSKDNGGLYENQQAGLWVTEFKNAANNQKVGVIGDPVETMYGYHIIKVENRDVMTFDKLDQATKDELKAAVVDTKLQNYLLEQEEKLDIKVTLPEEETPAEETPAEETPAETGSAPSGEGQQ